MPSIVGASGAFAAGIVAQAFSTYRKQYEINKQGLAMMGVLDYPSSRRQEIHFFWKTPAYPIRWPYGGAPMASKPFGGTQLDRKSTRLNSSHSQQSRMPSSA